MSDFAFPFPVLVCDTGGTNVRFALQPEPGARLGRSSISRPTIIRACPRRSRRPRRSSAARPRSMIVCGAGPVVGRTLKLTNAPWVMDGAETARRAGLAQGLLLNDFEAQALSLPAIPEGLGAARSVRSSSGRRAAGDSRTRAPDSASPRWSRRRDVSRPSRRRPATSTSGRSRRKTSQSGPISSARTGG